MPVGGGVKKFANVGFCKKKEQRLTLLAERFSRVARERKEIDLKGGRSEINIGGKYRTPF